MILSPRLLPFSNVTCWVASDWLKCSVHWPSGTPFWIRPSTIMPLGNKQSQILNWFWFIEFTYIECLSIFDDGMTLVEDEFDAFTIRIERIRGWNPGKQCLEIISMIRFKSLLNDSKGLQLISNHFIHSSRDHKHLQERGRPFGHPMITISYYDNFCEKFGFMNLFYYVLYDYINQRGFNFLISKNNCSHLRNVILHNIQLVILHLQRYIQKTETCKQDTNLLSML